MLHGKTEKDGSRTDVALLNAALRRTDVCNSVTVAAIHQVQDKTATGIADALRGSGVPCCPIASASLSLRNTIATEVRFAGL